jgi:hypothetical protein
MIIYEWKNAMSKIGNKHKVVFVDDEGEWSGPYIEFLGQSFNVIPFRDVVAAREYFECNHDIMALVVDIMMPTPEKVSASLTADGDLTGVWFLSQIKDYLVGAKVPAIVLTNKQLESVRSAIARLDIPKLLVECRQKRDTSRFLLPTIVRDMISRSGCSGG